MLRDKEIRTALVDHLMKRSPKPARVLEELTIDNGNAIADVVACYREMHCYEIKGETDNVRRILSQSEFYSRSFPKLTLVTTENHVRWAMEKIPAYWGIILATPSKERTMLRYVRKAGTNPMFSKRDALLMLWKAELTAIATAHPEVVFKKSFNRDAIAEHISYQLSRDDALAGIQGALIERRSNIVNYESDVSGS
ncbi:sce7726 family protein [Pseudomonas helleri]|uniref:sce7726 family protein n=1 Tax=Pseudomonas helleri TaxID=1608996 RepID=UPI0028E629A2|nr:sce7726 family protein [Pseudomonas helleri]